MINYAYVFLSTASIQRVDQSQLCENGKLIGERNGNEEVSKNSSINDD